MLLKKGGKECPLCFLPYIFTVHTTAQNQKKKLTELYRLLPCINLYSFCWATCTIQPRYWWLSSTLQSPSGSRCIKAAFRLTGACPQMTLGKRRGIIFEVSPVNHMSWHIETNTLVLRHPRAILESPINPSIWREPRHAWPLCMVVAVSSGWIINI